ncbi:3'-5' exonuclease [Chitinimonas lacunae]|uniref:DNA 3'-5' helicase n=1 Tax=Chitinimonas lacunae TaxID=1963018 RepID=A0ABV8MJ38_9NEIS
MIIDPQEFPENTQQLLAEKGSLLVRAGAGTGKSTFLAHAALRRVREGIAPHKIVVLTYSQAGRRAIGQYLEALAKAYRIELPQPQTFAAFAGRLAHTLVQAGFGPERLRICWDSSEALVVDTMREAIHLAAERRPDFHYPMATPASHEELIRRFAQLKGSQSLQALVEDDEHFLDQAERCDIEPALLEIFHQFEKLRLQRGFYLHQDVIELPASVVAREPEARRLFANRYDHILIDEAYDLNINHLNLLHAISHPRTVVVAVGDERQCIYRDQGASSQVMNSRFSELFPGVRQVDLPLSYRCGDKVARQMQALFGNPARFPLQSAGLFNTEVRFRASSDEADDVTERVQQWLNHDDFDTRCAILVHDLHDALEIEEALIRKNIPYRVQNAQMLIQREEILGLIALLAMGGERMGLIKPGRRHLLIGGLARLFFPEFHGPAFDEAMKELQRLAESRPRGGGGDDVASCQNLLANVAMAAFLDSLPSNADREGRKALRHSVLDAWVEICAIPDQMPAAEALVRLIEATALERVLEDSILSRSLLATRRATIARFIALARHHDWTVKQALQAFEQMGHANRWQVGERVRVTLSTCANAKGHEWDNVAICGLVEGRFPRLPRHSAAFAADDFEVERRLFYVGCTRARKRLWLFGPADAAISRRGETGNGPRLSRFVREMRGMEGDYVHSPQTTPATQQRRSRVPPGWKEAMLRRVKGVDDDETESSNEASGG